MTNKVHVVFGENAYLRRAAQRQLLSNFPSSASVVRMHARDLEEHGYAQVCKQRDLLQASCPTIYFIQAEDELLAFWQYIIANEVSNVLVFDYKKKSLGKSLLQHIQTAKAETVPCGKPRAGDYYPLVAQMCREQRLNLDRCGQKTLLAACGHDLDRLHNEVQKLSLIFAQENISTDDIRPHLGLLREETVFIITDLLLRKEYLQAQTQVENLLRQGAQALPLLGLLVYFTRNVLQAGSSAMPAFQQQKYQRFAGNKRHYLEVLQRCQATDAGLKSSAIAPVLAIYALIDDMAQAEQ